ncbi:hypothetical protein HHL26_06920 [Sphingobium sp. TB-6]|uniref:hypothetical protein n=1 Tax=Sphingobium sp. TB-6 TaxID=2728850 RepID=UPI001469D73C|nr:hypothetical protein [Sphingobium sp. TB-6]NML88799.1 hypothetical protein [Sphingobium sp. TB-6]
MGNIEKRISALEAVSGTDAGPYIIEIVRGQTLTKSEAAAREQQKPDGPVTRIELVGVLPEAEILPMVRAE